ncbi:nucleophile aminohydrolase [Tribonema minus]|uniref:Nucleophile aminohydrolase n=1 Tax=Tribonema minus TaxID=303371 RepID=A0A835YWZ6_9STRA|nr:nucleophile aminohydrolase [Tribonema minus]
MRRRRRIALVGCCCACVTRATLATYSFSESLTHQLTKLVPDQAPLQGLHHTAAAALPQLSITINGNIPSLKQTNWKEQVSKRADGWQPYEDNGGTVVAVAGPDFVIIGADTRLSVNYNILSRKVTRIHGISGARTFIGTAGCWSDTQGLLKAMQGLVGDYEWQQQHSISTAALARLLSNVLYSRRSFPFYTHNIVAGLDREGAGAVYGYDPVGSFERVKVACVGGGRSLLQPIMDHLAGDQDSSLDRRKPLVSVSCDDALELVKEGFVAAAERDIAIGDEAEILVIDAQGVTRHRLALGTH